ncbi:MAG: CpaD family pilus assembly protein [Parvibaculum sp.]|uniref:CpaD family pilus assembly protein n=1 Tax=Parvibaculum sp. TaxID=2024848 RepID=UPI0025F8CD72|nr:CpaD family pilus assembly protein [Parvibaculum sp.]MCE9650604.1 CpaD family pilus assembly protein [Parvibaculum sp.]
MKMKIPAINRSRRALRLLPFAAVLALAGCGGFNGANEASYDASYTHPISVQPDVPTLTVVSRGGGLSDEDRRAIAAFATAYKERGHGPLTVSTPSGSANTTVAMNTLVEVRDLLAEKGVPAANISYTPYRASSTSADAPIVLSYKRYVAAASPCGDWSTDYAYDPENVTPPNFGCATQANLAAMIADPADLIAPRDQTPADAQRRSTVFSKYRDGKITATERNAQDSAAVSGVAR